ncbi:hypothetical protein BBIA_1075 [Bifidobacterium biavatii DSM 23969]|uniref:Uncharacterized protein n=1 Tax=Bifidobacterium biavatii DSM 23969 TaxID=1437608 RepID=A0A087A2U9_9BIFI|nr:hypothetical protein BBIA_1075 [Bifidobacterium biavatii DSM 23969]
MPRRPPIWPTDSPRATGNVSNVASPGVEQIVAIVRNAGLTAAPTLLAPSVSPNFGELKRLSFSERDRRLRVHARVEADMAAVMLAYLPDPDVARQAGAALIRGDLTAYAKVVGDWRTRLRVRMPCT